jgi:hypothetical protein
MQLLHLCAAYRRVISRYRCGLVNTSVMILCGASEFIELLSGVSSGRLEWRLCDQTAPQLFYVSPSLLQRAHVLALD